MPASRRNLAAVGMTVAAMAVPLGATAASTITYSYDAFGQLVAVSSTAGRNVSYGYDAAGNRTSMVATGTNARNEAPLIQLASRSTEVAATVSKDETAAHVKSVGSRALR